MTSLLSRLQSLTGPDREVDAEIALAVGWTKHGNPDYLWQSPDGVVGPHWRTPTGQIFPQPPRYTESLDAALTLKEKNRNCVLKINNGYGKAEARVGGLPDEGFVIEQGEHEIPAIALLIAIERLKDYKS